MFLKQNLRKIIRNACGFPFCVSPGNKYKVCGTEEEREENWR